MRSNIGTIISFVIGILAGYFDVFEINSMYVLYILIFFIGISLGSYENIFNIISQIKIEMILTPFIVIGGSFLASVLWAIFFKENIIDIISINFGFGYYSVTSVLIENLKGPQLSLIAFFTNIFREIISIVFAPLWVKIFRKLSLVSVAGVTAMDTSLPVIIKYSGKEYLLVALFSGVVLTIIVPFLILYVAG